MIELSPDFITDSAKLDEICRTLDADELHVTDYDGVDDILIKFTK